MEPIKNYERSECTEAMNAEVCVKFQKSFLAKLLIDFIPFVSFEKVAIIWQIFFYILPFRAMELIH